MRKARHRAVPGFGSALVLGVAALPGTGAAPLESASLVLAHPAPHASVLATLERPGQALGSDGAAMANGLRLGDLQQRGAARPNREEQLRVLVTAGRAVAPVHCYLLLARRGWSRHLSSSGRRGACECFHEPAR